MWFFLCYLMIKERGLVLPQDDNIMLFSATLTNEKTDEVKALVEPGFLP